MYYITILDFANGSVDQYDLADHFDKRLLVNWQTEDFEEFITSEGYKLSDIEWMSHADPKIYKY